MKHHFKIINRLLIILLFSSAIFSRGEISGEVKNHKGWFVQNAIVRLEPYDYGENIIYETTTDVSGQFSIKKIKNGTYVLKISHYYHYTPFSKTITIDGGLIFKQDKRFYNIELEPPPEPKSTKPSNPIIDSINEKGLTKIIILPVLYLITILVLSVILLKFFKYLRKLKLFSRLKEKISKPKPKIVKEDGFFRKSWLSIKNYFISLLLKYKSYTEKKRLNRVKKRELKLEQAKKRRLFKEERRQLRLDRKETKRAERAEKKRKILENIKNAWLERGEQKRLEKAQKRLLDHEKYKIKMELKAEALRLEHKNKKNEIKNEKIIRSVKNPVKSLDDVKPNDETLTFIYRLIVFTTALYCYYTVWLGNTNFFAMYSPNVLRGEVWRFITPIFAHGNLSHIIGNMFALYLTSKMFSIIYDRNQFFKSYLTLGVAASICTFLWTMGNPVPSLGASGAIFGIFGMLVGHQNNAKNGSAIILFDLKPMWVYIGITIIMGLTTYGIDNAAHIGGLGAGYLYGYKFMAPNEV